MDKPAVEKKPEVAESGKPKEAKPVTTETEIEEKELDGVAGGRMPLKPLNPQPLPPYAPGF